MITHEEAHQIFTYNEEDGKLTRRTRPGPRAKPGRVVGNPYSNGYLRVSVGPAGSNKEYLLHRLIWMMKTGTWPTGEIDHINGVRDDNRWVNLRQCTSSENKQNLGIRKNNTSGHAGVSKKRGMEAWQANITVNKKQIFLGIFYSLEEAAEAYRRAKLKYHTFQPVSR